MNTPYTNEQLGRFRRSISAVMDRHFPPGSAQFLSLGIDINLNKVVLTSSSKRVLDELLALIDPAIPSNALEVIHAPGLRAHG